ncbi:restriction endonuclease subunit S [Polaromonas sp.]|jgi:type I restriction enzyme S subunit|uniref:restriction endonuclease subunit S n=1 Tax=Polaromonas sp. TaxID=1869339 RepID=UPI0037CA4C2D
MTSIRLGDVCQKIGSGATPRGGKDVYLEVGDVALIRSQNVYNDRFERPGLVYLTPEHSRQLDAVTVKAGDVLLNITGDSVARVCQVPSDVLPARVNQHVAIIRPDPSRLDPRFLRFYLASPPMQQHMLGLAGAGATRNALTKGMIERFEIPDIPLQEQKIIGVALGAIEDKVDRIRQINETIDLMVRTLFKGWFIDKGAEDWPTARLDEHVVAHRGLSYKGSGLCEAGEGLPMHNLNSVHEGGGYKYSGIKFYKGEFKDRHILSAGEIIVTNTEQGHQHRLIGFPAVVPAYYGQTGIFSQHIYRVKLVESTYLTREFIYYLLMSPKVRDQIISATNGSTVNMLPLHGLQAPTFDLPPRALVEQFSATTRPLWLKIERNHEQVRDLTKLLALLLPAVISGEVQLKSVEEELAEYL